MKRDLFSQRLWVFLAFLTYSSLCLNAQEWDDKVIISQCKDNYQIIENKGNPIVKNEKDITFLSNTVSTVAPETGALYGEFITLDNVSCKGEKIYKNITPENVFYDDTKVCIAKGYITKKGKTCNTSYKRTFKDIKYFTRVYLLEDFFTQTKVVTLTIPKSLKDYRIQEMNFKGFPIVSKHESTADADVYTYTITNAKRMKEDSSMPPFANIYPYLLIVGPFPTVNDLYTWSMEMSNVDCDIPNMPALLKEINANSKTDEDRISNTFKWVQEHIRYVAFEHGIAGHRPDTPKEVVRKRYGDCKGMALLLKTLLKAQGFDARLTDIGTNEVPYKMSDIPALGAANHAICTLFFKGKTYFLDATCDYIPYNYVPQHIQGSEAMIENGDTPLLKMVPKANPDQSLDSLSYTYHFANNALQGKATYMLRGDMKEWFMSSMAASSQKNHEEYLANNLNTDSHNMKVSNVKWTDKESQHEWTRFEGDVVNDAAWQEDGKEVYVDLNPHNNLFDRRIDTVRRTHDYYFPVRCNIVRRASFTIPAGYKVESLPASATLTTPEGTLSCSFTRKDNIIVFHQKMQINKRRIPLANIPKWNETIRKWKDACNEQVVLHK